MPSISPAFPDTRWSLVLRAREGTAPGAQAERALNDLCAAYWFPLYAFARRREIPPAEAEDLTQGFFALLLSRRLLDKADRERGRLRSFLLGGVQAPSLRRVPPRAPAAPRRRAGAALAGLGAGRGMARRAGRRRLARGAV